MEKLETVRLILRTPEPKDLPAFNYYASKSNIGPNAGWYPHQSLDESKHYLQLFIKENTTWAVTIKPHDIMVGTIGISDSEVYNHLGNAYEIGYVLDDTYWNNGYMTEAVAAVTMYLFTQKNASFVTICHADFNIASKKVIEKNGYKLDYITEKTFIANPDIKDVYCYKLSKKEYFKDENNT